MSSLNLYLRDKDKLALKRISAITGKSASDLVRDMINTLSAQYPVNEHLDIHMVWELRDVIVCKTPAKAWVSKDGKCCILRSQYNQRLNVPSPCDTDIVRTVNDPYQRTKIKVTGDMIYDTFIATKHINVLCAGGYEHDGIVWNELPTTEHAFYIEGDAV